MIELINFGIKELKMAKLENSIFATQKSKHLFSPKGLDGFF